MGALEMGTLGRDLGAEVAGTSGRQQRVEPPRAFAWGVGEDGQLGQGTLEDEHWPTQIAALDCLELKQLVAGSRNSLGITEQGRVYTWGWNQRGTLGFAGENKAESEPQELTGLAGKNIVQAAIGGWHCLAVDDTGQAYCWGGNEYGQCGLPVEKLFAGGPFVKKDITPPRPCAPALRVKSVSAGGMHSLVLTMDGEVWTWGQPLVATGYFDVWKPHRVTGVPRAVCAVAGAFHNLVLTEDGDVFAWGNGGYGQLGQGDTHNRSTPSVVQGLKGLQICQLAAGGWHSAALTEDGQLYMWGRGEHGRLGLGTDNKDKLQPVRVEPLAGEHIVHVSCGGSHSAALTKNGQLYVMGRGEFGRLGHGSTKTSNKPVPVTVGPGPKGENSPGARRVSFSRVAFDGTNSDSESETPGKASADEDGPRRASVNGDKAGGWDIVSVTCGGRHTLALAHPGWPKGSLEGGLEDVRNGRNVCAVRGGEESGKSERRADGNGEAAGVSSSNGGAPVEEAERRSAGGVTKGAEGVGIEEAVRSASLSGFTKLEGGSIGQKHDLEASEPVTVPSRQVSLDRPNSGTAHSAPAGSPETRQGDGAGPKPETWTPIPAVRTQNPFKSRRPSPAAALHHRPSFLSEDEDGDHECDDVSSLGSQPGDRSSPLSILEAHDVPGCLEAWACNRQRGLWPEEVGIKGKQLAEDLRLAGIVPEDMSDRG